MTVLFCGRSLFDFVSTSLQFVFPLVVVVVVVVVVVGSVSYIFYCSQQFGKNRQLQ